MTILKSGRPSLNKKKSLDLIEDNKQIVKASINLEKSFHKKIKSYAVENDITLTELIKVSLEEYMSK